MNGLYDEIRIALHAIWQRRWVALGVAWAIAIAGWLVVSQIPNSYESRARVFVQMQSLLPTKMGITVADQQKDIDRVRQTLISAVNLEKVVRGTDLARTVSSDRDVADRVASLGNAIRITAQQDNLFEITASGTSPKTTRAVVQKLIDIFVEENLAGERDETSQTLRFLDAQLEQRQKALQAAEAKRADFLNRYLGSLPGTGSLQERLSAARSAMAQVDSDLAIANSRLASINGQMAGTPPTIAGAGGTVTAGPARARLSAIQGQIAEARGRGYTDNHPDMVALRSQLSAAQAAARNEPVYGGGGGGANNPLYLSLKATQGEQQAQVAALMARKNQLQRDLDTLNAKLAEDPTVAAEQGEIERSYKVLKDQYDKLLADREEAKLREQVSSQTDAIKFSVIDPPTLPGTPTAPNRPMLLTGVLIVALGGGIAVAFGLTQLRTTFATAARLERASGMPVLGSIGEVVTAAETALRRRRLAQFGAATAGLGVAWIGLMAVEFITRGLTA